MKNKKIFAFLSVLLATSVVINSCSKESPSAAVGSLFTNGTWQLASVMRFNYVGSSQTSQDTLNTTCDTTQFFTFSTNKTCTYTNYHCIDQPTTTGTWALTTNGLVLNANLTCKDTVSADSCCTTVHPFADAQIVNIGLYSMVLQVGDIGSYYTSTQKRTLYRYGFVRKNASN